MLFKGKLSPKKNHHRSDARNCELFWRRLRISWKIFICNRTLHCRKASNNRWFLHFVDIGAYKCKCWIFSISRFSLKLLVYYIHNIHDISIKSLKPLFIFPASLSCEKRKISEVSRIYRTRQCQRIIFGRFKCHWYPGLQSWF